jgi:hypothetical protein
MSLLSKLPNSRMEQILSALKCQLARVKVVSTVHLCPENVIASNIGVTLETCHPVPQCNPLHVYWEEGLVCQQQRLQQQTNTRLMWSIRMPPRYIVNTPPSMRAQTDKAGVLLGYIFEDLAQSLLLLHQHVIVVVRAGPTSIPIIRCHHH